MSTYKFYGEGYGVMYAEPHRVPFFREVNAPDLIANAKLAITSAPTVPVALASTGFAIADVLQVFQVPLGFMLMAVGIRVTTADSDASTMNLGNNSATQTHLLGASAAGYMAATALNSAVTSVGAVGAAHLGRDNYMGVVFVTNGSIDGTFATAACDEAIYEVFADGKMVFNA